MRASLILFDVDGTLVDTAGAGRRALERAFRSVLGLPDIAAVSSRVRFNGKTDPVIIAEIAREAGLDRDAIARLAPALERAYLDALREEMARPDPRRRTIPGVVPLLEALASMREVTLGLLTGNIEEGARIKLDPFGLNRFFADGGFSSDHADRGAIARIAHDKLSRRAGIAFARERTWVVGDTELDVACARVNGFRAAAIDSGWIPRERLEQAEPDALFDDFTDVAAVIEALGLDPGARVPPHGS